ncbi:CTP synthase, partial [Alphaproteobacteria bacterium]|nr:CTP synthase [Alphaproteobacteria bacterium]
MKLIFVTGGVVSSLGKGIVTASLASLLRSRGIKIRIRKLDPYLNVDPGTMSPYQHGEVYVTDDGYETDLDLGHYERFTDITCSKNDSISSGKIYSSILSKERKGEYLGSTVQVIPHVTEEIKHFIKKSTNKDDVIICEIGGTVGDIESLPFLEAIRQFKNENHLDTLLIHLTLLPYIETSGEVKTKPTQHSVRELLNSGIQPDIIVCRSNKKISKEEIQKISLFCNVPSDSVIPSYDVESIYQVPNLLSKSKLDDLVIKKLHIRSPKKKDLIKWINFEILESRTKEDVNIFIIGKYVHLKDSYKSLYEAIYHAGVHNKANVVIKWLDSETINSKNVSELLKSACGVLIPGGFGNRGINGKIEAIKFARENQIPFLGICLGMQLSIIEFAKNVLKIKNAGSSEFGDYKNNLISLMTEWDFQNKKIKRTKNTDLGATMR